MATARIICKDEERGTHNFYMQYEAQEYYLFSQDFKKSVHSYYANGVILKHAIDHSRAKFDTAVNRTMKKIISHVRYVEKEYDIRVMNRA